MLALQSVCRLQGFLEKAGTTGSLVATLRSNAMRRLGIGVPYATSLFRSSHAETPMNITM